MKYRKRKFYSKNILFQESIRSGNEKISRNLPASRSQNLREDGEVVVQKMVFVSLIDSRNISLKICHPEARRICSEYLEQYPKQIPPIVGMTKAQHLSTLLSSMNLLI